MHRELGVYFKDLHVTGLGASASHQPTVGSMINPANVLHGVNDIRHPAVRNILQGFNGVVRPGEMLCASFFFQLAFPFRFPRLPLSTTTSNKVRMKF